MIPEDVCTNIYMYIKEISEYILYRYQKMHVHKNKEIGEYCMTPKDACTNKILRKSVNTDCIDTMQEITVYTMSLHYRIHAPKFFIVLYQILSWEGAAGGAATLLGQLYHSEVMESIEV